MTSYLTHWGRVTHTCVTKLNIIGSDNGLSPSRRQAIIRTNAGILLIGTLGTNFSEILSEIHTFSFKKMHLKMSSAKWRPFCLGLSVLIITWGNADLYQWHMQVLQGLDVLTLYGLVMPYGDIDHGQYWLRQWLAAWRYQAITWTNVDLPSVRTCGILLNAFPQSLLNIRSHTLKLKSIPLTFLPYQPAANAALAITPSHQQNTHDFADGCKNMNDIFNNHICSASHMRLGLHFQNV